MNQNPSIQHNAHKSDRSPAWTNFMEQCSLTSQWLQNIAQAVPSVEKMLGKEISPHWREPVNETEPQHPKELLTYAFSEKTVARGHIGPVVESLYKFTQSSDEIRAQQGRIVFCFEAPSKPQNIGQLANNRIRFLLQINEHWPYWLHFMAPTNANREVLTLILCHSLERSGGHVRVRSNVTGTRPTLDHLHRAMSILHAKELHADRAYTQTIFNGVLTILQGPR